MKGNPFLLVVCFAFLLSCSEENEVRQVLNEEVVLAMLPKLSYTGSGLQFSFRSDSIYECENTGFQYTFRNTIEDIGIHLLAVDVPDNCISGQSPAIENIDVPGSPGIYTVAIDIGQHVHNTGLLEVNSESYKLTLSSKSAMSVPDEVMYKIPDNTIWGFISNEQNLVADSVVTLVNDMFGGTDQPEMKEGYYGFFFYKPFPSVEITLVNTSTNPLAEPFIYKFNGKPIELQAKLKQLRDQLPEGYSISLYSWRGEIY